ncbi:MULTISPECIES: DsbC family protein [unclassified Modicisalibacter]|uniref:DsbC family protein n=1 Tax=unclassified Modicisalibacter TaxID=2679913 RepID=UPI001CCFBCCD|nr:MULTISPECIES: DsbC family protein [unclassified Modicisalibacter]MBZ9559068.1 DsbC family protein [Modicisalibacter sp. R2A 31.J]MBZ9576821.1 DsbC family protein [Modicisalibacter sp. MOD 31.J]
MNRFWKALGLAGVVMMLSGGGAAATTDDVPPTLDVLTINGQSVTPESVQRVDITGPIYEVRLRNGDVFYSDVQGRHMVVGNLYDNAPEGLVNVTEQNDRRGRLERLKRIPDDSLITFPAAGRPIGTVTVFTDTTCPYCQRLHQEIDQLNAGGVTVRYVPFPRAGGRSPAAHQLAQAICADSPKDALTAAFRGQVLDSAATERCRTAVEDGFRLGQRFGVQGTPSIVLPNGEMGEGYVPAHELITAVQRASE